MFCFVSGGNELRRLRKAGRGVRDSRVQATAERVRPSGEGPCPRAPTPQPGGESGGDTGSRPSYVHSTAAIECLLCARHLLGTGTEPGTSRGPALWAYLLEDSGEHGEGSQACEVRERVQVGTSCQVVSEGLLEEVTAELKPAERE